MYDQIFQMLGDFAGDIGQKKFGAPYNVSCGNGRISFEAEEFREDTLFLNLLQGMGIIAPPAKLKYVADTEGVYFSLKTGKEGSYTDERDIFVAKGNVVSVAKSFTKPGSLSYWILGIATFFTVVGPIIAVLMYYRQKHSASFGFDTDTDLGLVISFVGRGDIKRDLQPLYEEGLRYISDTPKSTGNANLNSAIQSSSDGWSSESNVDSEQASLDNVWGASTASSSDSYEVRPGEILWQSNREVKRLTKRQLVDNVKRGHISQFDKVSTDGVKWIEAGRVKGLFPTT